jgi:hypothetical protein
MGHSPLAIRADYMRKCPNQQNKAKFATRPHELLSPPIGVFLELDGELAKRGDLI